MSKVISDPNGRFIIITGKISGKNLILANIYGPNWDDDNFFKNVFLSLPDLNSAQVILGGDFNCCLDPVLDRSSNKLAVQSKSSKVIHHFMEQYAVSDAWRFFNPNDKKFSFFSPVHGTFSQIDLFLIDNRLLSTVTSCFYSPIVISDHAPVIIDIALPGRFVSRTHWRFDSLLLSDTEFIKTINSCIDLFISTNVNSEVSASTIWETCKAYLRGEIISYSAYQKKAKAEKNSALLRTISDLQAKYAESPNPDTFKELLLKKAEFDILTSNETTALLLRTRSNYYESGDKPSTLLAHQIRQNNSVSHINQINTEDGVTINPVAFAPVVRHCDRTISSSS